MRGSQIYNSIFNKYCLPELQTLIREWNYKNQVQYGELTVLKNITDIGSQQHDSYIYILNRADEQIIESVIQVIFALLKEYSLQYTLIPISITKLYLTQLSKEVSSFPVDLRDQEKVFAIIVDKDSPVLFILKKFGIGKNKIGKEMETELRKQYHFSETKYISLAKGNAYTEYINYNDDPNDPSRGTNIYDLKYFFDLLFDEDEYTEFHKQLSNLIVNIQDYYGFSIIKNLKPHTLSTYRYYAETRFVEDINKLDIDKVISPSQANILRNNFIHNEYYKMLFQTNDFAQSFISAEWIFNSLDGAGNIDLSPISIGFFKSVEQFLYLYISRHTNDLDPSERTIFDSYIKDEVPLTASYFKDKKKYITLGPLTGFFGRITKNNSLLPKNKDLLLPGIDDSTYKVIVRQFDKVNKLRNGNVHKDNITEMEVIKDHRTNIFYLFYLFFGAYRFNKDDLGLFGLKPYINKKDLQYLFEYIDNKSMIRNPLKLPIFYLEKEGENTKQVWPHADPYVTYDKNGIPSFSGAYFINKENSNERIVCAAEHMPDRILEGELIIAKENPFDITYTEPRLIFNNGSVQL